MKEIELAPEDVIIDPEFRTRRVEPDAKKVTSIAVSMWTRYENGMNPQIQAGVVRPGEGDTHILVVGETRLLALRQLNESLPAGTEPFKFRAVVVRENDSQAIVTSIEENHFRSATNIFDRAAAIEKLVGLGMTQEQIGAKLGLKQGSISDALAAGKLGKKYQSMVASGKLTEEAAIVLARIPTDKRDEVLQASVEYQEALESIEARSAEQEEAEEETAPAKGKKGNTKPDVPKAKEGKKPKITAEVVKTVARKKGAMKEGPGKKQRTMKDLILFGATFFGPEVSEELPEPARDLFEHIEKWADMDRQDAWLKAKILEVVRERYKESSKAA